MNCKGNIINFNPAKNTIILAKTSFAALNNLWPSEPTTLTPSATIRTTNSSQAYLVYDKRAGEFAFDATVEGTCHVAKIFAVLDIKPTSLRPNKLLCSEL